MSTRTKAGPADISGYTEKETLPMWKPNSVIRHRTNGSVLLVVHVYTNCTIVVKLETNDGLVPPMALLERDYHYYARDTEMKNDDPIDYGKDWHYAPVKM